VKVTELAPVSPIAEPDPELVADLERLLADVRSGHVSSILAVWGTASGGMTGRLIQVGGRDSLLALIGEAVLLQQRLIDDVREQNDGEI
jgi:hypothetical protein